MTVVPEYDWHPTQKCGPHGIQLALCLDGEYRCIFCTADDKLLRFSYVRKGS